ncbi:MAG: DUF3179 domain-containing protein [Patescibacteria group bacterium]
MKNITKTFAVIIFGVAVIAILFGVQSMRNKEVEKELNLPTLTKGLLDEPEVFEGESYLVPPEQIYDSGTGTEGVPAIDNPKFISVTAADEFLADDLFGIDVEVDGQHRFYSYQILNWHEVVNDEFNGKKIAVTMCAFCRTPIVFEREVDGQVLEFENAGKIYNNNFLIKDRQTESLWWQLKGLAISGELIETELNVYPSIAMKWKDWKKAYPNGEVLSTETGYVRDYTRHPFGTYDESKMIYFPLNHVEEARLQPKWIVQGLANDNEQIAFADIIMKGVGAANEELGGMNLAALWDFDMEITRVFKAELGSAVVALNYSFEDDEYTDEETGSVWNAQGYAVSGKRSGAQLEQIDTIESFWFCWAAGYPQTMVSKVDSSGTLIPNENNEE